MSWIESVNLSTLAILFVVSALVIGVCGAQLAKVAEIIALETGLGQAIVGALFIGISTSLSGTVLSFYAASQSFPSLAISNAIGGVAAQTVFLAIADLTYRKVNLEHAAASLENLAQGTLLLILLPIPLLAMTGPDWTVFNIHPASGLLLLSYILGLKVIQSTRNEPMWRPKLTQETQVEQNQSKSSKGLKPGTIGSFILLALVLAFTGLLLAKIAVELSARTGLSESWIGGFFTSISTSLPELVTVLAAVRRGALNLAVGDIIGGNCFDVLFLVGSDVFFTAGSIYHRMESSHVLLISMAMLMTAVLILGMLRREKVGPAGIGFESLIILGLYALMAIMMLG